MILVIGGRSKIGTALIGELLGQEQEVRALVGESERAHFPHRPGKPKRGSSRHPPTRKA